MEPIIPIVLIGIVIWLVFSNARIENQCDCHCCQPEPDEKDFL